MDIIKNKIFNQYPTTSVMTGLALVSTPYFLNNMAKPIPTLLFFVAWSFITAFSNELLVNKKNNGKPNYNKLKAVFIIVQTLVNVGVMAILPSLFS